MEKYEWSEEDAISFSSFLLPMLKPDPSKRATAAQCLTDPWLTLDPTTQTLIVKVCFFIFWRQIQKSLFLVNFTKKSKVKII